MLAAILSLPDGPDKTARLVAWVQGLYESDRPTLVGGAAVELLTGGAYTTGDLDFVGRVPQDVADKLAAAGFEKKGRHWVHEVGQVFIEFPGDELEEGETSVELEAAGHLLLVLGPEAVLVDRLAAWQFWSSTVDAVNGFLVYRAAGEQLEERRLTDLVRRRQVEAAWESLQAFAERFSDSEPTPEDLAEWAERAEF